MALLASKGLPEFRVVGPMEIQRLVWTDPQDPEGREFDLTGMKVTRIERDQRVGDIPIVRISFIARLVEEDMT